MIEFEQKLSLKNGNKVTKKNWHKVVAQSIKPCTNIHGVPAINAAREKEGAYYCKYKLVYEQHEAPDRTGYIFREVNANTGISGMHQTPKEAIFSALNYDMKVYLED